MLVLVMGVVVTASAQNSAVRVNTLGIATGTINAGLDVGVSARWSVEGSVYWNPIKGGGFRSQGAAFSLGARYWRYEPHVGRSSDSTTRLYSTMPEPEADSIKAG